MRRRRRRADPTDARHADNWFGGYYELAIKLGLPDDARLDAAVRSLWAAAALPEGSRRDPQSPDAGPTEVSAQNLLAGHLSSVATIPDLGSTVCSVMVVREATFDTDEPRHIMDWLDLCLPMGALGNLVGPSVHDSSAPARGWREPIERWFEDIARAVHATVPFLHAVTGLEVSGDEPTEARRGMEAFFLPAPDGSLTVEPVTRW